MQRISECKLLSGRVARLSNSRAVPLEREVAKSLDNLFNGLATRGVCANGLAVSEPQGTRLYQSLGKGARRGHVPRVLFISGR